MRDNDQREMVVLLLQSKGYEVSAVGAGSGVPRNSRLVIRRDGKELKCSVKCSEGGRISYTRTAVGTYKVLSEVDWVIHVSPDGMGNVRISAFDSDKVRDAFEANFAAQEARGMGHLPLWIGPQFEEGPRFVGSGFAKSALWVESVPIGSRPHSAAPEEAAAEEHNVIEQARAMIAARMGVPVDLVQIDVRIGRGSSGH